MRRLLELVEQQSARCGQVVTVGRGNLRRSLFRQRFLPGTRLKEASVHDALQLLVPQRVDTDLVSEELHDQRNAQVRGCEVREQQLRILGA